MSKNTSVIFSIPLFKNGGVMCYYSVTTLKND